MMAAINSKKVLLLGDSYTFGVYLRDSDTVASSLQNVANKSQKCISVPTQVTQMVTKSTKYTRGFIKISPKSNQIILFTMFLLEMTYLGLIELPGKI